MATSRAVIRPGTALLAAILGLAGCASGQDAPVVAPEEPETAPEEVIVAPEAPKNFSLPATCVDIVGSDVYQKLTSEPVLLLRGPGSDSPDPVYPDGSPQEDLGGISCYFGDIEETMTYTLSIAPVTRENRAGVIEGLLEQKFNPDQTDSGALIYSILGDEISTPATYNTLYQEAWYEVLVSPGGRLSFEQAEILARAMRDHTFR